jgi:16S rRNA U516 pseudouridylate synthase RsuA-like enzyme
VKVLRRFQIGGLVLRKMPLGDCRPLSRKEIDEIFGA